ncbi:hypothetical protein FJW10_17270 [Mesorhizobium sp. B4-1-1]|nr:hypothetical protein FJW10_17270 [Mesorhizobium sp. B4-1-1]
MITRPALAGLLLIVSQSAYAQSDDEMAACVDRANGATASQAGFATRGLAKPVSPGATVEFVGGLSADYVAQQ